MYRAYWIALLMTLPTLCVAAPHKRLDLRNKTDANGEYSVSLCARSSDGPMKLPGHAFVSYNFKPTGKEWRSFALGFTTNSAVKGMLSYSKLLAQPAGYLNEEMYSSVNENCLLLLVNESDFNKAMSRAQPFHTIPALASLKYTAVYSLTSNDCITFMTEVAGEFKPRGVNVPVRSATDLPLVYLRKLIDAN